MLFQQLSFTYTAVIVLVATFFGMFWAAKLYNRLHSLHSQSPSDQTSKLLHQANSSFLICQRVQQGTLELKGILEFSILMGSVTACLLGLFLSIYTAIACMLGVIVSSYSSYFSMQVAASTNNKVILSASQSIDHCYKTIMTACLTIGFATVSVQLFALLVLLVLLYGLQGCALQHYNTDRMQCLTDMFNGMAGFGLGTALTAVCGRIGGGIFQKASSMGADLIGKGYEDMPQDSPRNPVGIVRFVGWSSEVMGVTCDNLDSLSECCCAGLIISSSSITTSTGELDLRNQSLILMIPAVGILISIFVSNSLLILAKVFNKKDILMALKNHLYLPIILALPAMWVTASLSQEQDILFNMKTVHYMVPYYCILAGMLLKVIVAWGAQYHTCSVFMPVQELQHACKSGPATNIIYGIALGQRSTLIPVVAGAALLLYCLNVLELYGVLLATMGMLADLPLKLAVDCYAPIADCVRGISEMSGAGNQVKIRTEVLSSAGSITCSISRCANIVIGIMVCLGMYGAFISLSQDKKSIADGNALAGLLLGSAIPYVFCALTMRSFNEVTIQLVKDIHILLKKQPGILYGQIQHDFKATIHKISSASINGLKWLIVVILPLVLIYLIGGKGIIAGLIPGSIVSGMQLAISSVNSSSAWESSHDGIEAGKVATYENNQNNEILQAAEVGRMVGDPLCGAGVGMMVKVVSIGLVLMRCVVVEMWKRGENV